MGAEESKPSPTRSPPPQLRGKTNESEAFSCFVNKQPTEPHRRVRPQPPPTFLCCGGGKSSLSREEILQNTKEYHNDASVGTISSYQAVLGSILDMTDEVYYKSKKEFECSCKGECSCALREAKSNYEKDKKIVDDYERKYKRQAGKSLGTFSEDF